MKTWNPKYYHEHCTMQYKTALEMLQTLPLNGNETILDVGCGTGNITNEIAKRIPNGKIIGIDASSEMIEFADEIYQKENLSFLYQNVLELDYHNQFDYIVSFWTLSWINETDQKIALMKMKLALKDDGKLFLMYPLRHDVYNTINNVTKMPRWNPIFLEQEYSRPFITQERYLGLLKDLLIDATVLEKKLTCEFDNFQAMVESIKTWLPHLDKLESEIDKQLFAEDVANNYLSENGYVKPVMCFSILEIAAQKKPVLQDIPKDTAYLSCKL